MIDLFLRPYQPADEAAVVALWQACELIRPWNDPYKDMQRKLAVQPELFLVALVETQLVGTVMAGYDGHRGWVNYLAVAPQFRRQGLGRRLMHECETRLLALGCPKINLQVRSTNEAVLEFYRRLGYAVDDVIGLGKRIIPDESAT